ncbi:MAG TPA: hypothetical protein VG890_03865 [Puia sp.]|nr:hypothetical protein [Puia sp.]
MLLTAIGQWLILFIPLEVGVSLAIVGALMLVTLFFRKRFLDFLRRRVILLPKRSPAFITCIACFLLLILVLNAGPVGMDDTESYHIQMIKWIQEFGTVPGIANLHLRFGFNSAWFTAVAVLTHSGPNLNNYLSLNGLLCFWFCYYLLEKAFMLHGKRSVQQALGCLVILGLSLLDWFVIRCSAMSANYDFITTACIVLLFVELSESPDVIPWEWLMWPVFLFTVRIINFPLLVLSLVFITDRLRKKGFASLVIPMVMIFAFLVPFIWRNILLSGYPFFPSGFMNWFPVDWKVDNQLRLQILDYIKYFNRINAGIQPVTVTRQLGFPAWLGPWYRNLFTVDKWLFTFSFPGFLYLAIFRRKSYTLLQKLWLFVTAFIFVSWWLIAPEPRFIQGIMLFVFYQVVADLSLSSRFFKPGVLKTACIGMALLVLTYGVLKWVRIPDYGNIFLPKALPVPDYRTLKLDGLELHIPFRILNNWNPRCYDLALPCLYQLDPRVEARGIRLSDGFRIKPEDRNIRYTGEYRTK